VKSKPHTPSAAPLDAHLGFWLRFVSNHVSARFQELLDAHDISASEWVALRTMFDQSVSSHTLLIRVLGMTKGATSKVISRLAKKGLAQRQYVEGRAREQSLLLTAKGKALVPQLATLADANDKHFFGHLRPPERDALMRTMQALVSHHQFHEIPTA
jgi:DNA-binding MarR family transcriptional regulator